jgi:hypothetical protein
MSDLQQKIIGLASHFKSEIFFPVHKKKKSARSWGKKEGKSDLKMGKIS